MKYDEILEDLQAKGSLRVLPQVEHEGKYVRRNGCRMLNLSGNDYLGLAGNRMLRNEFLQWMADRDIPFSSSSSRLLTGNYPVYAGLEERIAFAFGREAALLFNSGYHANIGILPAVTNKRTLVLADKLVHASIIDGILLSGCPFLRYRHTDYGHLEQLLEKEKGKYEQYILVTESLFSMDGDLADLKRLVSLRSLFPDVLLYVDEAHAVGVRGNNGLGLAEETGCIPEIDFLVGTFGKALASVGAYVVCSETMRRYLVNTMRPLIFSTALPPVNIAWSSFVFERLSRWSAEREHLSEISRMLRDHLAGITGTITSASHIVPFVVGENEACIRKAEALQQGGFYCLPVRPPTVPAGPSRVRFSLTADMTEEDVERLIRFIR